MTAEAKKILEQALALPAQERPALIDALADSIVSDEQAEVDEACPRSNMLRRSRARAGQGGGRATMPEASNGCYEPSAPPFAA